MSKYNVGLKTLLLQGLSEPEFSGDLVYKFRKGIGKNDFPDDGRSDFRLNDGTILNLT